MITKSITRKFGKLVRIDVTFDKVIREIKITSDFFLHPEETLDQIVRALTGIELPIQKEKIVRELNYVFHNNEAEMIGLSIDDIVNTLHEVTQ